MILEIDSLKIHYSTRAGDVRAVDGASFAVPEGRIVGLVGESGCGKTTAVRAIMGVLAENGRRAGGRVVFKGQTIDEAATRKLLWRDIRARRFALAHTRIAAGPTLGEWIHYLRLPQRDAWAGTPPFDDRAGRAPSAPAVNDAMRS